MALLIVAPLQETLLPKVMAVQECKNSKLDIRQNPDKDAGRKFNELTSKKTERPSSEKIGFHKNETTKASKDAAVATKQDAPQNAVEAQKDSLSQTPEGQTKDLQEGFFTLMDISSESENFDDLILTNQIDRDDPLILDGASISPTLVQSTQLKDLDTKEVQIDSTDTKQDDLSKDELLAVDQDLTPALYQPTQKETRVDSGQTNTRGTGTQAPQINSITQATGGNETAAAPEKNLEAQTQLVAENMPQESASLKRDLEGENKLSLKDLKQFDAGKLHKESDASEKPLVMSADQADILPVSNSEKSEFIQGQQKDSPTLEEMRPEAEPTSKTENATLHSSFTISGSQTIKSPEAIVQPTTLQAQLTPTPTEQISYQIRTNLVEKQDEITVELRPASLGSVKIKIEVSPDGRSNVIVAAERAETLDLLRKDQMILQESLKDSGVDLGNGNLEYQLFQDQSMEQQRSQASQSPYSRAAAKEPASTIATTIQTYRPTHNGVWEAFA